MSTLSNWTKRTVPSLPIALKHAALLYLLWQALAGARIVFESEPDSEGRKYSDILFRIGDGELMEHTSICTLVQHLNTQFLTPAAL